jgi:hypothetical protein
MRRALAYATAVGLALGIPLPLNSARSADTQTITRVEEDWQLVIDSPSTDEVGPQITTCMSAVSDGSDPFVAFDMNYREYPDFRPGGMQLQVWSNNQVDGTASQHDDQLAEDGETITWTQSMSLSGSTITYQVKNGQSDTWDEFGGGSNLLVSFSSTAPDLSGYSPDTSAKKSGVTWESNRVTSMTLLRVRYYAGSVLVNTDSTSRTIDLGN